MISSPSLRFPGEFAKRTPDKPAVISAETGRTCTYAQLDAFANRLARYYRSIGLRPGGHVAYCVENRLECPAIQWGAHYAGLYYTFISTRLTPKEASYIVQDCGAQVVVLSSGTASALADALCGRANAPTLLSLDAGCNMPRLEDLLADQDSSPIEGATEGSEMLYSSGTTGRPKGVKPALSGKPLGDASMIADLMTRGFRATADTVYLSPAPYYHAAPMKWSMGTTSIGGTLVLMEKFDAEGALRAIARYRVTHSQWVPTMFHRLLALDAKVKRTHDLSSHEVAIHAAAPCPIPIKRAMIEWWGPIVYEYYSCTEGIGMTFTDTPAWLSRPGTVGRALMGVPHIVGEDGRELPAEQEGTVYFAGGHPFTYHNDEAKTREARNAEGWATVGDIGHLDGDGFLYLTDRKSNMIISGGVNVYPQETENVLATHPKVFDCAVIGTPHEDLGEEVRAIIQLRPGIAIDTTLAEELIAWCRKELSPIKCPRKVDFRHELPREPNGKLLKRLLRDEYREKYAAGRPLS